MRPNAREGLEAEAATADSETDPKVVPELYLGEPFDPFYRREYRRMVALAYALSGSRWAAEDLAQDAFLVAHRRWEDVSRYDHPEAFVRRVVANTAMSRARRVGAEGRAWARATLGARPGFAHLDPDNGGFWDAVRALPRRQSQAVALHFLEDRPAADIARILGCSEATVRVHLHRGLSTLARQLRLKEDLTP